MHFRPSKNYESKRVKFQVLQNTSQESRSNRASLKLDLHYVRNIFIKHCVLNQELQKLKKNV